MSKALDEIRKILRARRVLYGENETTVPYLKIYRYNTENVPMPKIENPYLYFIIDGSIRLYTPSGIMDYISGQYSASAIDTPLSGRILTFSEEDDFLALSVEFTLNDAISVVLDIEGDLAERIVSSKLTDDAMAAADAMILEPVARALALLDDEDSLSFMSGQLKREIIFNALRGSCGKQFLQSIINIQQADDIYKANSWIKQNYKESFSVEKLAERQNMSVSNFHQKFKSAVGMGPLQCQKRLRLTEARRLMIDENLGVTDAAMDVGYESVSQFIRDYKKMYVASPKGDIQKIIKNRRTKAQSD